MPSAWFRAKIVNHIPTIPTLFNPFTSGAKQQIFRLRSMSIPGTGIPKSNTNNAAIGFCFSTNAVWSSKLVGGWPLAVVAAVRRSDRLRQQPINHRRVSFDRNSIAFWDSFVGTVGCCWPRSRSAIGLEICQRLWDWDPAGRDKFKPTAKRI